LKDDLDATRVPEVPEIPNMESEASLQTSKTLYVIERLLISGTPFRPTTVAEKDWLFDPFEIEPESPVSQAANSPAIDPLRITDESPHIIRLLSIWEQISLFEREGFESLDPPPWNSSSRFQELRQMLEYWLLRLPRDLQFSFETLELRSLEGKGAQLVFLHWYLPLK
jgi:hypothetical protein